MNTAYSLGHPRQPWGRLWRLPALCLQCVLCAVWSLCALQQAHAQAPDTPQAAPSPVHYVAVALHDVVDRTEELDADAITSDRLVAFFDWLQGNGWHPISLDDIAQAQAGRKPLPPKPILLSFDDGYASLYSRVYPLVLAYRFPIVAALVGEWMDAAPETPVRYGDQTVPRSHFISWEQARIMQASGLVEFASHGFGLHTSLLANPQGNRLPAATTRMLRADGSHESAADQHARVLADLLRSRAAMQAALGRAPRALVWPFGRYNANGVQAAQEAGFAFALTLQPSPATLAQPLHIARYWPSHNPSLADLVATLSTPAQAPTAQRLVCVNPATLWHADPAIFDSRLGQAIERMRLLGATTAVVQALSAAPQPEGAPRALPSAWFPNASLPLQADALSRIAWQLRTRAGVQVVARLPHQPLAAAGLSPAQRDAVFATLGAQIPWDGLLLEGGDTADARRALAAAQANSPELRAIWLAPPGAPVPAPANAGPAAEALPGQPLTPPDLVLYPPATLAALLAQGRLRSDQAARTGLWLEGAEPLTAEALSAAARAFQLQGGTALGWCPDDPLADQPAAARVAPAVSAATFPLRF